MEIYLAGEKEKSLIGKTEMPVSTMQLLKRKGIPFRQTGRDIEIKYEGSRGELGDLLKLQIENL